MFADRPRRYNPGNRRQASIGCLLIEVVDRLDAIEFAIIDDGVKEWQRIPNTRRFRILRNWRAVFRLIIFAVRFSSVDNIITPADAVVVQQKSEVRPGVDRVWPGLPLGPVKVRR